MNPIKSIASHHPNLTTKNKKKSKDDICFFQQGEHGWCHNTHSKSRKKITVAVHREHKFKIPLLKKKERKSIPKLNICSLQVMNLERSTCLHPPFPFLRLMPIQVKYRFSRECWSVSMFLQRCHCWNYDEEKVQKEEQIPIVTLFKK